MDVVFFPHIRQSTLTKDAPYFLAFPSPPHAHWIIRLKVTGCLSAMSSSDGSWKITKEEGSVYRPNVCALLSEFWKDFHRLHYRRSFVNLPHYRRWLLIAMILGHHEGARWFQEIQSCFRKLYDPVRFDVFPQNPDQNLPQKSHPVMRFVILTNAKNDCASVRCDGLGH